MRIAIVTTMAGGPWGGSEELWTDMAEAALAEGHEVAALIYRWPTVPPRILRLQQDGARILKRSRHRLPKLSNALAKLARRPVSLPRPAKLITAFTFKNFSDFKPDVVCVSQAAPFDAEEQRELVQWLDDTSTPYVVVSHFNNDAWVLADGTRKLATAFLSRARSAAFVSQRNLKTVERQLATSLANALVVRNPVNLTELNALPWPEGESIKMASVAQLRANDKGQDILLESLAAEVWRGRNWRLHLFGEGPDKEYLKRLAGHYGIAERIAFRGHVADVRSIWAECHLLALPSRAEGTPLALVEAMICGRPSVVTDVGGNAEFVEEPQTGFVAEAATARSFGAALERAWCAQAGWRRAGQNAHEQALRKLDHAPGKTFLNVVLDAACASDASAHKARTGTQAVAAVPARDCDNPQELPVEGVSR
jgi:glycosyltransferase involved in cell wall biosynthesis